MHIENIELEVLHIILEYVNDSSPQTLSRSAVNVSRYFREAAKVVQHRRKTMTISGPISKCLERNKWCKDKVVLQHMRHLTVNTANMPWGENYKPDDQASQDRFLQDFEPFNSFLRQIQNLKTLTWNAGPLPYTLLSALKHKHPTAKLKVFNFIRFHSHLDHLDRSETELSTFPNLTHLRFSPSTHPNLMVLSSEIHPSHNYATFHSMVSRSRSLEYAGIVLPLRDTATVKYPTLGSRAASTGSRKCNNLRSLTLDGRHIRLCKKSLEQLDQYVDISGLESLKFSKGVADADYFSNASVLLPNIKHVSLNLLNLGISDMVDHDPNRFDTVLAAAKGYLLKCSPLQSLSIWSWSRVITIEEVLQHHGATLQALQLHEKEIRTHFDTESVDRYERACDLAAVDVARIRACPNLSELTIDVARDICNINLKDQPRLLALLEELAQFRPPLSKVQLYLDSNGIGSYLSGSLRRWHTNFDSDRVGIDNDNNQGEDEDENAEARVNSAGSAAEPPTTIGDSEGEDDIGKTPFEAVQTHVDPETTMSRYVASLWHQVFGSAKNGDRRLDVKFGEWESDQHEMFNDSVDARRLFEVSPHERDDKTGECTIKVKRK